MSASRDLLEPGVESFNGLTALPPLVLNKIFNNVDNDSKKAARLVCMDWENLITASGQFKIKVNDTKEGNLDFVRRVQEPKSLRLLKLDEKNYPVVGKLQSTTIQSLECIGRFTGTFFAQNVLPCNNLTRLNLAGPIFWSTDFASGSSLEEGNRQQFVHLKWLEIIASDLVEQEFDVLEAMNNWFNLTGTNVRQVAKNICYVLRSIRSQNLEKIMIDDEYSKNRIRCEARRGFRWENGALVEFLSYHSATLRIVDLPYFPYPARSEISFERLQNLPVPMKLDELALCTWCEKNVIRPKLQNRILFQDHEFRLLWLDKEYTHRSQDEKFGSKERLFWTKTIDSQENLQDFRLDSAELWNWSTFANLLRKNRNTLLNMKIEGNIENGRINCAIFQDVSKLEDLGINQATNAIQDFELFNLDQLPNNLLSISLRNVCISGLELAHLGKLPKLELLQVKVKNVFNNNVFMEVLPAEVIRSLFRSRSLKCILLIGFGVGNNEDEDLTNALTHVLQDSCKADSDSQYYIRLGE